MDELVCRSLAVSKLAQGTQQAQIEVAFGQFGDVRSVVFDPSGKAARVDYWDIRAAQRARVGMKDQKLCGSEIEVQYAAPGSRPKERNTGTLYVRPITLDRSSADPNSLQQYRDIFNRYGDVKKINTNRKRETEKFVEYNDLRAAEAALQGLNGVEFNGVKLEIHFANRSSKTPAREGLDTVASCNTSSSLYNSNMRKRGPAIWMHPQSEGARTATAEKGTVELVSAPSSRAFGAVLSDAVLIGGATAFPLKDSALEATSNQQSTIAMPQPFYTTTTTPLEESVTVTGADDSRESSVPYKMIRPAVVPAVLTDSIDCPGVRLANSGQPSRSVPSPGAGWNYMEEFDGLAESSRRYSYERLPREDWKIAPPIQMPGPVNVVRNRSGFSYNPVVLNNPESGEVDSQRDESQKASGCNTETNVNGNSEPYTETATTFGFDARGFGSRNPLEVCNGLAPTGLPEGVQCNSDSSVPEYFTGAAKPVVASGSTNSNEVVLGGMQQASVASHWGPGTKLQWHGSAGPTATLMALLSSGSNNPPG